MEIFATNLETRHLETILKLEQLVVHLQHNSQVKLMCREDVKMFL